MVSTSDPHLPQNIFSEVLSMLPVKSLLRLKCLCKHWYTLSKSRYFISKHFNQENNHARLLVHYQTPHTLKYDVAMFHDETLPGMRVSPINEDPDHLHVPMEIKAVVGPIDGLFFLQNRSDNRMALWNPATREFRLLPVPHSHFPPYFYTIRSTFGFGLDPVTRNCKFIWITYFWNEQTNKPCPYYVAALHTLGSDSWRYLDPIGYSNCSIENSLYATYVNGTYYWLLSDIDDNKGILSFDMSSEVFRDIQGPNQTGETWGSLTLYNESIAMFCWQKHVVLQSIIDIFVMEEEGCWTKLFTVEPVREVIQPLGFWKNQDILFESSTSQLVLQRLDPNETINLAIDGDGTEIIRSVFSYKESLVLECLG